MFILSSYQNQSRKYKQTLKYCAMKNAMMVATLCTMFISQALCQEAIYREWIFSNEDVTSVALYKMDISHKADVDWHEEFKSKQPMTLVEIKLMSDTTFFDFEEFGVYSFVSKTLSGFEFKHTHIVLDQDYIDVQRERGWVADENGVPSSKAMPLRITRSESVFVSSETL